jgi:hypothetical protein
VLAGLLGVIVLIFAVVVAWRDEAAVALLIVAAVLLALGLFDWTELRASHGDTSFMARRHLDKAKDGMQALSDRAAEQGWSDEDQNAVRGALDALAAASAAAASSEPEPWGTATASHEFCEDGSVLLRLYSGKAHMISFMCIVEDPSRRRWSLVRGLDLPKLPPNVWVIETTFPDDFDTDYHGISWGPPVPDPVPKMPGGKYRVWWQEQDLQSGAFLATPIAAEDSFEIPDPWNQDTAEYGVVRANA